MRLQDLPGGNLVEKGQVDLEDGRETVEALLVSIVAPRLRKAGFRLPGVLPDASPPGARLEQAASYLAASRRPLVRVRAGLPGEP